MSESLDHLAPECQEEAGFSAEARIRATLTERWIAYPRAALALERLHHLLNYPPRDRMPCLLLYGATGMGKTKILRKFIRDHPTSFNAKTGINAVLLVAIQIPPEPDEKTLYLQLLYALHVPTRHRHPTSQLRQIVGDLLKFTNTPMLIIDEVHSLLAGTCRQQRILLNTLRYLANKLQLLVCASASEAKRALLTDQQWADRFEAIELPVWQNVANLTSAGQLSSDPALTETFGVDENGSTAGNPAADGRRDGPHGAAHRSSRDGGHPVRAGKHSDAGFLGPGRPGSVTVDGELCLVLTGGSSLGGGPFRCGRKRANFCTRGFRAWLPVIS